MRHLEVRETACSTCIYRKDNPLDLAALEAQIADPHMDGFFRWWRACHHHDDEAGVVCRGFWNRHKDDFGAGQLAQRLNLVRFVGDDHSPHPIITGKNSPL